VPTLRLTGTDLSIADVLAVARRNTPVALDRAAERRMSESAKLVAELAAGDAPVYGVNTGFGDLATVRIPIGELRAADGPHQPDADQQREQERDG